MSMAVMAFMAMNFGKDILWAFLWMFVIKKNEILVMFLALVFLLLSIPLYHSVLREIKNNQKSDKNQLYLFFKLNLFKYICKSIKIRNEPVNLFAIFCFDVHAVWEYCSC